MIQIPPEYEIIPSTLQTLDMAVDPALVGFLLQFFVRNGLESVNSEDVTNTYVYEDLMNKV